MLGNARLLFDEMGTVLVEEIDATLNSRPLAYDYDEFEREVLTSSHLFFGRRIMSLQHENVSRLDDEEECIPLSDNFRYISTRLPHSWTRWWNEYLADLREYHWSKPGANFRVTEIGDVVAVHEDNKRGSWEMAVVERVSGGATSRVIFKVRLVPMSRPIQKLYPIKVKSVTEQDKPQVVCLTLQTPIEKTLNGQQP